VDRRRAKRLRRSRALAAGLLALAGASFAATLMIPNPGPALLLLLAVAEAALVGGLADWFAVTPRCFAAHWVCQSRTPRSCPPIRSASARGWHASSIATSWRPSCCFLSFGHFKSPTKSPRGWLAVATLKYWRARLPRRCLTCCALCMTGRSPAFSSYSMALSRLLDTTPPRCRRCKRIAELKVRIHPPPAVSPRTIGSAAKPREQVVLTSRRYIA